MRWKQIITEAVATYRPMFASFYPDGIPNDVIATIKKVEALMKRKDRVVWLLRWERFGELGFHVDQEAPPEELAMAKKIQQKLMRDLSATALDVYTARQESDRAANMWADFEHWFSLPISGIQNYVFHKQLPSEVHDAFMELEDEWKESRKRAIEHKDEPYGWNSSKAPTKIIDFGNGWAWFDLEKQSCDKEGDAMGHCGNAAGSYGETVLSLRQNVGANFWEPHVTFILDSDGFIGEMKGRNNERPVERYHQMIVALLKDDRVFGIKGGGYMPENNFALSDLSDEEQEELKALKPGFRSLSELIRDGELDSAIMVAETMISAKGLPACVGFDKHGALISRYNTVEQYARLEIDGWNEIFDEVDKALSREENGDHMSSMFRDHYFVESLKEHVYDFNHFQADCSVEFVGGISDPVEVRLSWDGLEDALAPNDDYNYNSVREALDETTGDLSDSDPNGYLDEIDERLMGVMAEGRYSKSSAAFNTLLDAIRSEYTGVGSGWGSPTSRDPNQLGFDFG